MLSEPSRAPPQRYELFLCVLGHGPLPPGPSRNDCQRSRASSRAGLRQHRHDCVLSPAGSTGIARWTSARRAARIGGGEARE
jgi:hypothetical protein